METLERDGGESLRALRSVLKADLGLQLDSAAEADVLAYMHAHRISPDNPLVLAFVDLLRVRSQIAAITAEGADRIQSIFEAQANKRLIVDDTQVTSAAIAGVNAALARVGDEAIAKAAGPRVDAAIARFESARSWMHILYATIFAVIVLAAFALAEYRYVHDSAFSDGYRAGARATQQTNAHRH